MKVSGGQKPSRCQKPGAIPIGKWEIIPILSMDIQAFQRLHYWIKTRIQTNIPKDDAGLNSI